ncbi:MAG: MBL fold metallo-hydrolase [Propionibacteriaceae bacterium]|jgi:L-ascorbate metabolism protein UlaG (beta-lactamase superfamily)|nr:MBL fold metallo-hydrolase [Propionibacteriaceae bacterium]
MKITHLGHSSVLIETEVRILIDPGNFSRAWHGLTDLDAIVVTHAHLDHIDPDHLPRLLENNSSARLLVEPSISGSVDLPSAEGLAAGTTAKIGKTEIEAIGGLHAIIHRDIPRIGNVGVVIREEGEPTFFHPGDAVDVAPEGVDIAGIPTHAPWCAMKEIIDFTRVLGAKHGFLIHDGLVNERGWGLTFSRLTEMTETSLTDIRDGEPLVI